MQWLLAGMPLLDVYRDPAGVDPAHPCPGHTGVGPVILQLHVGGVNGQALARHLLLPPLIIIAIIISTIVIIIRCIIISLLTKTL